MKKVFAVGGPGIDTTLPDVFITLNGGEETPLTFDLHAIVKTEQLTGRNLLTESVDIANISFKGVAAMLYASLRPSKPDIELAEVESWVSLGNVFIFFEAVRNAWGASAPEATGDDDQGESRAQDQPEA